MFIYFSLGHLEAIGSQGTLLGNIREIKFAPDGRYFYKHFLRGRQPVVIRNAASHWLALRNWPNETYLNMTYGELPFTIHLCKVYRDSICVYKDMNLSDFLENYKQQAMYLDSQFPPSNLINEINLPPILQCGEITSTISDVNLLMNSGNSSSPLHHDGYENILAIVSGTKKVILFNSSYNQHVYADDFNALPGLSPIDPQKVDLEKFPNFADIMYYESELHPGKCRYCTNKSGDHVNDTINGIDDDDIFRRYSIYSSILVALCHIEWLTKYCCQYLV